MAGRFFPGYRWRWIVTDLALATTTWAQGLWQNRRVALTLGQASVMEGAVYPNDFRVNGLWEDDYPRINASNRLLFGFRDSGPTGSNPGRWEVAAAGIIMSLEDQGDAESSLSHVVAYDPRQLLYARPCMDEDGNLWPVETPTSGDPVINLSGFTYVGMSAGEIGLTLLKNTIENEGGVFIDAGPLWGGTNQYAGTIEVTDDVLFNVVPGTSVGDAWDQLEETGLVEFVLTPIYDTDRFITVDGEDYYFTHELSVYQLAGEDRYGAQFSWDMMQRNLDRITRMQDKTPGNFANKVLAFAGAGGVPVPVTGPTVGSGTVNGASIADFGVYWNLQFQPTQGFGDLASTVVLAMAQQTLRLQKQGTRTLNLTPIPDRAPVPLIDYFLGDRVPVFATRAYRQVTEGLLRVQGIPIEIPDDGAYERVVGNQVTPDWDTDAS